MIKQGLFFLSPIPGCLVEVHKHVSLLLKATYVCRHLKVYRCYCDIYLISFVRLWITPSMQISNLDWERRMGVQSSNTYRWLHSSGEASVVYSRFRDVFAKSKSWMWCTRQVDLLLHSHDDGRTFAYNWEYGASLCRARQVFLNHAWIATDQFSTSSSHVIVMLTCWCTICLLLGRQNFI
jgi:hypothetical protein